MNFSDIPVPEAYKESSDFRFFLKWFALCLTKIQNQTENLIDLLDPERCPTNLLWLLCDTVGYKYDDRLPVSFNRLALLHFMSLIRNRGSKTGVTLAAELNVAQFNLIDYAEENEAYRERLVDTNLPVNSVYVNSHADDGYIDIVYYSERIPTDACLEYVRPVGMYCFTHAGVRVDAKTKLSVDARLTDKNNLSLNIGPTRVGHYRRADYASMQRMVDNNGNPDIEKRHQVYYRNSVAEGRTTNLIYPGLRTLYSLQISNNEHIVKSLLPSQKDPEYSIFSLGYGPQDVTVTYPDNYLKNSDKPMFNLRYDEEAERELGADVYTLDPERTSTVTDPKPAVNPRMAQIGDAMSMNSMNTLYTAHDEDGNIIIKDVTE